MQAGKGVLGAHAGMMINNDHLKRVIGRTMNNPAKTSANKLLPRPQDSAFGDFPATHKPKKEDKVEPLPDTRGFEASAAAPATRK